MAAVKVRIPRNGLNCEMKRRRSLSLMFSLLRVILDVLPYQLHGKIWYLHRTFLFLLPLILHLLLRISIVFLPVAIYLDRIHTRLSLYVLARRSTKPRAS